MFELVLGVGLILPSAGRATMEIICVDSMCLNFGSSSFPCAFGSYNYKL